MNLQFPVEVGTFQSDARALRKRHGQDLRFVGNIDKLALARGREAIDAEIRRLRPLTEAGGMIPMADHYIPPGVALDDYRWYLDRIRDLRLSGPS